jgi:hypothetical protein
MFRCGSFRPRVRLGPLDPLVPRVPVAPQVFRTSFRMIFSRCVFGVYGGISAVLGNWCGLCSPVCRIFRGLFVCSGPRRVCGMCGSLGSLFVYVVECSQFVLLYRLPVRRPI